MSGSMDNSKTLRIEVVGFEVVEDGNGGKYARYLISCAEAGTSWQVERRWSDLRSERPPLLPHAQLSQDLYHRFALA